MLPIDLTGRVALVTGGVRGIGRACADAVARAGSAVAVVDLDLGAAQAAADEIAKAFGVKTSAAACDVRERAAVRAAVISVVEAHGRLDTVINNAGVQHVSSIADFPDEKYDFVRAIDLDGVFHVTQAAWKHLAASKQGRVVNVASVHGLVASPYKVAYVAAKHGVVGMTKVAALEGAADGITVNAICPGAVMTDLVRGQAKDLAASYGGGISEEDALRRAFLQAMPTDRFIEPQEVGGLCAFLCSAYAVSITGAAIAIDGGWSAR